MVRSSSNASIETLGVGEKFAAEAALAIAHPRGNRTHGAIREQAEVDTLAIGQPVRALHFELFAEQRMPRIVNDYGE
jgi:hypothetical protein